ncbi:MAG: histidinol dehydrogenase, partial [Sulfobacillus sp.]
RTAGALFVGQYAGQALGDYTAGPSHVLPTGGSGRFLSGLTTRTFMRRMSVIRTQDDLPDTYFHHTEKLAQMEGLHYHEKSMRVRRQRKETLKR